MTILIPAYEPDKRLLTVIDQLKIISDMPIVVVDDGSGPAYDNLFRQAEWRGCTILTHPVNHGKGCALKTGFDFIFVRGEREGVITADCDGQHTPEDILKLADAVRTSSGCLILGSRRFTGKVPLRSRFGKTVTRLAFRYVTGVPVTDTDTGLRGFPVDTIPFARRVPGDRFNLK